MAHEAGVIPVRSAYRIMSLYEARIRELHKENEWLKAQVKEKEISPGDQDQ